MIGGSGSNTVAERRERRRVLPAAASALGAVLALAGCVPANTEGASPTAVPSASNTLNVSAAASPAPAPTPEALIVPGCETLLPLTTAQSIFSDQTEVLSAEDSVPIGGDELPEIVTAISNASIAKYCVWGVPNSDGGFTLSIVDISEADAANLKTTLLGSGFVGATTDGLTSLELSAENMVGTHADTHYLIGDLWIHTSGTSLGLTSNVAEEALAELRLANPSRTY